MRAAAVLALGCLLLAGCSGGSPPRAADGSSSPTGGAGGAHAGHDAGQHLLAPAWQLGDSWTMESPQGGTFSHVVSKDAGEDWVVDTDNADTAFFDARGDISFLGKVRKSDLAGSQGDKRVEFLRFPLMAGLNWTTTWDGQPTAIRVVDVKDGTATLSAARANGTRYADYAYSDAARYFSRFAFYDDAGATVAYEWTLRSSGAFTGTLVRWALTPLYGVSGPIPTSQQASFTVQPGFGDIWVQGDLECSAGAIALAVGPPTGPSDMRGYEQSGACPASDHSAYAVAAPAAAEQWGAFLSSAPTTAGTLDLAILGRVKSEFKVGEAP